MVVSIRCVAADIFPSVSLVVFTRSLAVVLQFAFFTAKAVIVLGKINLNLLPAHADIG